MERLLTALLLLAMGGLFGPLVCGCQWALINYHEKSKDSDALMCLRNEEQPNAYECWDYFETKAKQQTGEVKL